MTYQQEIEQVIKRSDLVAWAGQNGDATVTLTAMDRAYLSSLAALLRDYPWLSNGIEYVTMAEADHAMWSLFSGVLEVETMKMAVLSEIKTAGSNGGTFTAGSWVQRSLNTLLSPDNIVTLSSNNITILETGKYRLWGVVPASGVNYHQSRLTKNGAELAVGTVGLVGQIAANAHSHVFFCGFLNAGDVIRLEHKASATYITYGLGAGIDATWGNLVFSVMEIIQYS